MSTSACLGIVTANGKQHFLYKNFTDASEAEFQIKDIAGSLRSVGDALEGQRVTRIQIQLAEPSSLTTFKIYGANGAVLASYRGGRRAIITDPTGPFRRHTLDIQGLNLQIQRSLVFKCNTAN